MKRWVYRCACGHKTVPLDTQRLEENQRWYVSCDGCHTKSRWLERSESRLCL